jgi:phage tail sheath protein FI
MVIYAKKLIKIAMDQLVFEPHNSDSWARATNLINTILEPIRQNNGISDYRVTIDGTTNTASLIQQSIMSGVIQLVPVGTIEIIELDIKINAAGTAIAG